MRVVNCWIEAIGKEDERKIEEEEEEVGDEDMCKKKKAHNTMLTWERMSGMHKEIKE